MMIHCLLVGTFMSLIGMSYPQTAIIRDGMLAYRAMYIAILCNSKSL